MATGVATPPTSRLLSVILSALQAPPTPCAQGIDEGAEIPSLWDALTGEAVGDREKWLPQWLPQATQPVNRLIRSQQVSGSTPLVGSIPRSLRAALHNVVDTLFPFGGLLS